MAMANRVAISLAFALAGCGTPASSDKKTAVFPADAVEQTPHPASAESPVRVASPTPADPKAVVQLYGPYVAISNTAMGVTGDMVIRSGSFAFKYDQSYDVGPPYRVAVRDVPGLTEFAGTISGDTVMTIWPVLAEHVGKKAPNGNLCGEVVHFIGTAPYDSSGDPELILVAFSSDKRPGPGSSADSPCASFTFQTEAAFADMVRENREMLRKDRQK